jgi:AraC-like DNA-binding protein
MSDAMGGNGVLYTEYASRTALSPHLTSLWSFESGNQDGARRPLAVSRHGNYEFWLDRSDPLLNVMLPDTSISLIVNLANAGAVGASLATAMVLPRVCVLGPGTRARFVRMGKSIRAVGAGIDPSLALPLFGLPAAKLVDRVLPLHTFWGTARVHELTASMRRLELEASAAALDAEIERRLGRARSLGGFERQITDLIKEQQGRISVDEMTRRQGVNRQLIARRFRDAVGLSPKLFARITRFQRLVQVLLANDVSEWARVCTAAGYYDQAHMINEFRTFAGAPPTLFFQRARTHGQARRHLRGRPSEWLSQEVHDGVAEHLG